MNYYINITKESILEILITEKDIHYGYIYRLPNEKEVIKRIFKNIHEYADFYTHKAKIIQN